MKHNLSLARRLATNTVPKFYLFLSIFSLLPVFIFSTRLFICDKPVPDKIAVVVNIGFAAFLYFIYDAIRHNKKCGFVLALAFNIAFLTNNIAMLNNKAPILLIEGVNASAHSFESPVIFASILINIIITVFIVYYLLDNQKEKE